MHNVNGMKLLLRSASLESSAMRLSNRNPRNLRGPQRAAFIHSRRTGSFQFIDPIQQNRIVCLPRRSITPPEEISTGVTVSQRPFATRCESARRCTGPSRRRQSVSRTPPRIRRAARSDARTWLQTTADFGALLPEGTNEWRACAPAADRQPQSQSRSRPLPQHQRQLTGEPAAAAIKNSSSTAALAPTGKPRESLAPSSGNASHGERQNERDAI
jgi:hypothetical protein